MNMSMWLFYVVITVLLLAFARTRIKAVILSRLD